MSVIDFANTKSQKLNTTVSQNLRNCDINNTNNIKKHLTTKFNFTDQDDCAAIETYI